VAADVVPDVGDDELGTRPPGQAFGEKACHPEPIRFAQGKLREGSGSPDAEILRCAQDDSQDTAQVLSREVFSPNVCLLGAYHLKCDW
jgi:hypothetical protein